MLRWLILSMLMPVMAAAGPPDLPGPVKQRILRDPDRWQAGMVRLIAGFGGAAGLDAAGFDRHAAIERAAARAEAAARLLVADLDGDGAVAAAELAAYLPVLSARGRGGFALLAAEADADGDGGLDAAEVKAHAAQAGLRRFPDRRLEEAKAVLAFDADGDGAVGVAELRAGLAALRGGG